MIIIFIYYDRKQNCSDLKNEKGENRNKKM